MTTHQKFIDSWMLSMLLFFTNKLINMYHIIKIGVCKLNKDHNDVRLFYCRNKGLIYAIGKIGEYYGPRCRKGIFNRGIDFLSKNLEIYGEPVSKSELRSLARPNRKKDHTLRIPDRSVEILEAIIQYLDNHQESSVHLRCKERNRLCLQRKNVKEYLCYPYLIGELIVQLNRVVGNLHPQSEVYQIAMALIGNYKICN